MARLLIHVEGQTEETFVVEILRPHLIQFGYWDVSPRIIGNARQRSRRGGIRPWPTVRKDVERQIKSDPRCLQSTMVDYYALPQDDNGGWPGRAEAGRMAFPKKAASIEKALLDDLCAHLGDMFRPQQFIPFVAMHEFEGLLFSDCERFAAGVGKATLASEFQEIRDAFSSPEAINDSKETAPSKRVEKLVPGYEKPLQGVLAALEIGLEAMRRECPHFQSWIERLEAWPQD